MRRWIMLGVAVATMAGCRTAARSELRGEQRAFWQSLARLCGSAFEGRLVEVSPSDTSFAGKSLVMHPHSCSDTAIRIAFNVGENRSRTWVLTRTQAGLRLKHDHRHEDGSEDTITQYGGDTRTAGDATKQEFHADAHTIALIPAAATNVWTITIEPRKSFTYALRREGTDRRFRVDFDTSRPVAAPQPSWGHSRR